MVDLCRGNIKLGPALVSTRALKDKFSKFHRDFDDYMQKNADNTFSSSNFLRILEHLRVRALPSRPSKLTAGFIPKPADFFPEITPTKQQISDYINLIYHFKEFLFDEVLKNKNSLLEGDFEETILQLVNQLTGEVEKEKLEFTVMDSLEQLTELEDFLQTIQNMFGLCNSEDVINDYSDTEELYTLRKFTIVSGLFNTHSESCSYRNPRKYRANTTNGQHTRKFDVSQYDIRSNSNQSVH